MKTNAFLVASPYNLLILFSVIVAAYIVFRHVQKKESQKINKTLDMLLYLSGITVLMGALGFFLEMSRASCTHLLPGSSFVTLVCTVPESVEEIQTMATCYGKSASAMLTGLFATLIMALVWYILRLRDNNV